MTIVGHYGGISESYVSNKGEDMESLSLHANEYTELTFRPFIQWPPSSIDSDASRSSSFVNSECYLGIMIQLLERKVGSLKFIESQ